ncbi:MAG: O-antigen ligase family protein [Planctomycetes bacterium]|nr:O-antigen ligase family protein [Planctomycetota bacterium]
MSPSKRHSQTHPKPSGVRRPAEQADSSLEKLLKWSLGVLIAARMLIPAESAVQGDSLWIVQLWLGLGVLWAWNCRVNGDDRIRFGWIDLTLWLLVAGHVVSALFVVVTAGGDQRAALNIMWEWVGLGISFFLLRQILRGRSEGRNLLVAIVAASAVLAGLGVWQHYVSIPQTAEIVDKQIMELTRLENASALGLSRDALRIQELRRDLRSLPQEEPARSLFLTRLRFSREPFGLFALANSFAGLLLPAFFLAVGLVMGVRRTNSPRVFFVTVVMIVLPIAFCLLLTKSRTAWVGLAAGLLTWGLLRLQRGESPTLKRKFVWGLSIILIVVGFFTVAGLSGGLDREVISETPKSLKYRLQYWTGAWKVIQNRPLLGTGPGNFRQHYLQHKAPESSEEISDPHNLVLDVWTSGGLLGVIGLLGFCIVGMRTLLNADRSGVGVTVESVENDEKKADRSKKQNRAGSLQPPLRMSDPLMIGVASSFVVVYGVGWLLSGDLDHRLVVLFTSWLVLIAVLAAKVRSVRLPSECLAGACVALLVHLLGAGGIEMPAITQTLIVLIALGAMNSSSGDEKTSNDQRPLLVSQDRRKMFPVVLAVGGGCVLLFAYCLATSTMPVLNRNSLLALGDNDWSERGNLSAAMAKYRKAAEVDPFSPEPPERLAELSFQRWKDKPVVSEDDFMPVYQFSELAIELDPYNVRHYRALGLRYLEKFVRTENSADAARAVEYLSQATGRYPHNSRLRVELAVALKRSGRLTQAMQEAEEALRLDEINHREKHEDKYLLPGVRQAMQRFIDADRNSQPIPNSRHNRN